MDLLEGVRSYWQIIFFIGGLVWTWSRLNSQIKELNGDNLRMEKSISALENKHDLMNANYTIIQSRLASIEATLEFIKQQLQANSHKLGLS